MPSGPLPSTTSETTSARTTSALRPAGAFRLLAAFAHEQSDPGRFYTLLARDSVALVERHTELDGRQVVDVGGGAGYFADAFRDRGAQCLLVEPDPGELYSHGDPGRASVIGDGYWLPLADATVDVCFSCNVLEHVKDPAGFIDEMIRVTRPGGLVYLSYTAWLSPWGGHETSPFHYLGGLRGPPLCPPPRPGAQEPVRAEYVSARRRPRPGPGAPPRRCHRGRGAAPLLPALLPVPDLPARAARTADVETPGHTAAAGVTTQRLSLEEIFSHQTGSSDDGSPPPRRRLRGWGEAAERAGLRWTVVVWVLVLAALIAADPGRMTFDTKLGVDIDPVGFYRQLWHLWNPLEGFGGLQDQYSGYAFPMGAFYLVAHLLHVPVWLTERSWMSLLLMVAFWGPVKLAETLGFGSRPSRLLAWAAFALWPTFTILVGSASAGVLPGVLAPWAVLPLTRSGPAWTGAARSGLVVACMGGVNAASTLAAIVPAGLYALTRPGRRRWVLAAWWTAAVLLATSWWLVPLLYQARYGFNFLPHIEQAATTTQTMSAAAALRGSGNWVA